MKPQLCTMSKIPTPQVRMWRQATLNCLRDSNGQNFCGVTRSCLPSPAHHMWPAKAGLYLPLRHCRQCLPAQSISRACAREAGQGGNARHKNTAETKSCNCKWPLTSTRPHLLVVFEVCRQRPVPVPLIPHPGAHQRWNAERLSLPQGHAVTSQNQVCGMGGGCPE